MRFGQQRTVLNYVFFILLCLIRYKSTTDILPPACPQDCICLSQTQVLCNSGGLRDIPTKFLPPTVEHLSLTRNTFAVIKSDAFAGLRYLRHLSLDGNNVSVIKPFAFRSLPRLRELSIQQTPLKTVAQFTFAALHNLTSLHLSHNRIEQIEQYAFAGTTNLRLLILTHNPIVRLAAHAFSGLTAVERILLPTGIRYLEPGTFLGLETVGVLKLAHMELVDGVRNGTFTGLQDVEVLSLQECDLGVIQAGAFDAMTHVRHFYWSNNKIDRIEELILTDDQHIGHFKLYGNHILEIPLREQLHLAVGRLSVISNHFPCTDCRIHDLLTGPLMSNCSSRYEFTARNYCMSPMTVHGWAMSDVDIDSIDVCHPNVDDSNTMIDDSIRIGQIVNNEQQSSSSGGSDETVPLNLCICALIIILVD